MRRIKEKNDVSSVIFFLNHKFYKFAYSGLSMVNDQESSFKWFLLIAFSIAWVSFGCAILYAYFNKNTAASVFSIIGALGPIIAPLSLMLTYRDKEYNTNFWKRMYYPKIGPMWLVLLPVILPVVVNFLPVLLSIGSGTIFSLGTILSSHGIFLIFALCGIFGWYGYAFPQLHKRLKEPKEFKIKPFKNPHKLNKLKIFLGHIDRIIERIVLAFQNIHKINTWIYAGLITGVLWSAWFIPIAFINGTSYFDFSANFVFWEFLVLLPIQSVIISWIFTKTKMSTFVVLIFFLADITILFFSISIVFQIIRIILWTLIMAAIILNELLFHIIKVPEST